MFVALLIYQVFSRLSANFELQVCDTPVLILDHSQLIQMDQNCRHRHSYQGFEYLIFCLFLPHALADHLRMSFAKIYEQTITHL